MQSSLDEVTLKEIQDWSFIDPNDKEARPKQLEPTGEIAVFLKNRVTCEDADNAYREVEQQIIVQNPAISRSGYIPSQAETKVWGSIYVNDRRSERKDISFFLRDCLRHKASHWGLIVRSDGFCTLDSVLECAGRHGLPNITVAEIIDQVYWSNKSRYQLWISTWSERGEDLSSLPREQHLSLIHI